MRGIVDGDLGGADPCHRRFQIVEGAHQELRRDLRRQAAGAPALVDHHRAVGSAQRGQERRGVEGPQRAQVDHLGIDALARQLFGGPQRLAQTASVGDEREVPAGAAHRGEIEVDCSLAPCSASAPVFSSWVWASWCAAISACARSEACRVASCASASSMASRAAQSAASNEPDSACWRYPLPDGRTSLTLTGQQAIARLALLVPMTFA
ncbi:MAG: hypothetical protein A3K18_05720 [Lentisphaerae bacterium RIFOXYA12_64_32]|nr:MAG: hypothetical protein A3K18_05720 [Lentisphaerae bacterium RIFOXYA12_64_32]